MKDDVISLVNAFQILARQSQPIVLLRANGDHEGLKSRPAQ